MPLPSAPMNVLYTVIFGMVAGACFFLYWLLQRRRAKTGENTAEVNVAEDGAVDETRLQKVFLAIGFSFAVVAVGFFAMAMAIRLGSVFGWYYW